MDVWVTTGTTESGDAVGPYVWAFEPTAQEVENVLRMDWWEEYEAGCPINSQTEVSGVIEAFTAD